MVGGPCSKSLSNSSASWIGCIQGLNFSSRDPAGSPVRVPSKPWGVRRPGGGIRGRAPSFLDRRPWPLKFCRCRLAHSVTSLIRSSSKASKAKCCSRLRGLMPQTPSRQSRMGNHFLPAGIDFGQSGCVWCWSLRSACNTHWGNRLPWPFKSNSPSTRKRDIFSAETVISIMPV